MVQPNSCFRSAFQLFERQIDELETNAGLVNAAIAIAMHSFDDLTQRSVWKRLQELVDLVQKRCGATKLGETKNATTGHSTIKSGGNIEARIAHFHQVLFFEEGYIAQHNRQASHLLDSFISTVLELKVGSPELIGLLYKVVADNIGLDVDAVEWNDQLYARLHDGHGWLLVDLFRQTTTLDAEVTFSIGELRPMTHRRWVRRMLTWNRERLHNASCLEDFAAMGELLSLLDADSTLQF